MSTEKTQDMDNIASSVASRGVLDYVSAWYLKAAAYIKGTLIRCAFVSTNSITQGEQVGILWSHLFHRLKVKIHFAHSTFVWANEASGKAHVHVVIIGFGLQEISTTRLYTYDGDGK